jgi:S-adenosylmethionine:tRNA-ribosyltransferase-isomerase (queuine synthetase)
MPEPTPLTPPQLKKALIEAGFEVFRTRGDEIVLAERPRENLIMDSGVRLKAGQPLQIRVVMRAQKADYPNEDEPHLFERVRKLAASAAKEGFVEIDATVSRVTDPGDASRTLDTFYEIVFAKDAGSLEIAVAGLKFALGLEKRA